ncbi:helix-turn-helix domain-containing protein [Devosia faecipullorum]|uniref:helix-turn-helix domain-containing protein n=1 Tax=Devosia faecipullorum TaxID=2755039 RepID=UPI00187B3CDC|nr:helix-turn-helix domain-containing protein [Devosia faecipullorum]MBE7731463.1 helix-turn-helix domain-containing protein [Devosia faecipullorum]
MVLVLKKPKQAPPPDDPDGPRYTAKEAAAILGMSVKTLMKHVSEGRLRFIGSGTGKVRRHYRFTQKNLTTFTQNQKVRKTPICPSLPPLKHPSTSTSSKSTVVSFAALQKPGPKKKL